MTGCRRYLRQIRSLAHNATRFDRCIALILSIIESGGVDDDGKEDQRIFVSLFPIRLSGTHATIEQRLAIIRSLILSDDTRKVTLGLAALKAVLEAVHFGPGWDFEFGTQARDYGWQPLSAADVRHWYGQSLNLVEEFACSNKTVSRDVRAILAEQFRGLWSAARMHDDLERVCRRIADTGFWPEGWIAVRQTIHYDSSGMPPEISARLAALEGVLRPQALPDKVRSIVLSDAVIYVGTESKDDDTEDISIRSARMEGIARDLGRQVAKNKDVCEELLPGPSESVSQRDLRTRYKHGMS
jgi:hypothetical protein